MAPRSAFIFLFINIPTVSMLVWPYSSRSSSPTFKARIIENSNLYGQSNNLGDYVIVDLSAKLPEDLSVADVPFDLGICHFVLNGGGFNSKIHDEITSMEIDQFKDIEIFGGTYYDEMAADVPKSKFQGGLIVGDIVRLNNGLKARITKVTEDFITIDANSRLAGITYQLKIHLLDRKPLKYLQEVVFAAGCFWGVELAFQRIQGIAYTAVGYTQGTVDNPSYEEVCTGTTGHTEAVKVLYDPSIVTFEKLLDVLFERHDPTQLNGQGNDIGTQYRSGIYYTTQEQLQISTLKIENIQKKYKNPIVTELKPLGIFWDAEDYHQRYLEKGGQNSKKNAMETIRCYG